jgi:hypothetical protein
MCTVYDRIFGYFPTKTTIYTLYIYIYICVVLANPIYVTAVLEPCLVLIADLIAFDL